jgi:hypothetical protein
MRLSVITTSPKTPNRAKPTIPKRRRARKAPARRGASSSVSIWLPIPQKREFCVGPNGFTACHSGRVTMTNAYSATTPP